MENLKTTKLISTSLVVLLTVLITFALFTKNLHGQIWREKTKYSQETSSMLENKFSLKLEKATLHEALQIISKSSGINIIYGDTLVYGVKDISCDFHNIELNEILEFILSGTKLTYFLSKSSSLIIIKEEYLSKQTGTITGVVTNKETGEPLASVNLQLNKKPWGTLSKYNGVYRFDKITEGEYELIASAVGYKKQMIPNIKVPNGEVTTVNVRMQPAIVELETMVVTGNKIPVHQKEMGFFVSVIDEKQIENREAKSLADVLRGSVPGIYHVGGIGGGYVRIRGVGSLSNPNIAYYINGIPVDGQELSSLTLENIERVEIVRGPQATALYGIDATEGIIQMFTKRKYNKKVKYSFSVAGGIGKNENNDYKPIIQDYRISTSGTFGIYNYWIAGSYYGFDDNYKNKSLSLSLTATPNDNWNLYFWGRYNNINRAITNEYTSLGFSSRSQNKQSYIIGGINVSFVPVSWWSQSFTFGMGVLRSLTNSSYSYTGIVSGNDIQTEINSKYTSTFLNYNTAFLYSLQDNVRFQTIVGVDFFSKSNVNSFVSRPNKTNEITSDSLINEQTPRFSNVGYYIQNNIKLWDKLFLNAGVRVEKSNYFGENIGFTINPRFSISLLLTPISWWISKPRAAIGRAIKSPLSQMDINFVHNKNLQPENNLGWEVGIDNYILNGTIEFQITYYDQQSKNLIVMIPVSPVDQYPLQSEFINLGEISNRGWEFVIKLSAQKTLAAGITYSRFYNRLIKANYNDVQFSEKEGEELNGVAKDAGSIFLEHHPSDKLTSLIDIYYVGKRKSSMVVLPDGLTEYLPAFINVNIKLQYQIFDSISIFVKINNLFNSRVNEMENVLPPQLQSFIGGVRVTL